MEDGLQSGGEDKGSCGAVDVSDDDDYANGGMGMGVLQEPAKYARFL